MDPLKRRRPWDLRGCGDRDYASAKWRKRDVLRGMDDRSTVGVCAGWLNCDLLCDATMADL